jgi:hypothetical protein
MGIGKMGVVNSEKIVEDYLQDSKNSRVYIPAAHKICLRHSVRNDSSEMTLVPSREPHSWV